MAGSCLPEQRIGIEYEGADHGRPERVLLGGGRYTRLVDAGWRMYRFTKYQMYAEPDETAATIGAPWPRAEDRTELHGPWRGPEGR